MKRIPYTKEEDMIIKEHYENKPTKEIALMLGRPVGGIRHRANRLGISQRKLFTNEEDKVITENWGKSSVKEIAKMLNRKEKSIYTRAKMLSLEMPEHTYILYRGGVYVFEGTAQQCADFAGVTRNHIYVMVTRSYQNKPRKWRSKNYLEVAKMNEEELA